MKQEREKLEGRRQWRIGGKVTIMRWAWDGKEKEEVKWEQEAFAEGMRTQSAKIWAVAGGDQ